MENNCLIKTDGVCLYVSTEVRAERTGKLMLLVLNLLIWTGIVALIANVEDRAIGEALLLLLIMGVIRHYTLGKYTLWNFFGKESFINTKSFSYQHDYGFYRTNLTTKDFTRLRVEYRNLREEKGTLSGKLFFFHYNERELPELLFETTLLIPQKYAECIIAGINELFADRMAEKYQFPYPSLN